MLIDGSFPEEMVKSFASIFGADYRKINKP
jgi:hypothetical protein